ncbi:MAG: glycosyltransferase family 2 protein [Pseudomonadota bacterium]
MTATDPMVTVITATWNLIDAGRADLVRGAAESLFSQTFRDMEWLIQDGASTDGTVDLLQDLVDHAPADLSARLISEPDQGLYDAMNRAVAAARGRYVLFLNSDDTFFGPDSLALLAAAVNDTEADFAYGQVEIAQPETHDVSIWKADLFRFLRTMPFGHNAALYRRSMFLELDGFDLSYKSAADYDFICRMIADGYRGRAISETVYRFLLGGHSAEEARDSHESSTLLRNIYARWVQASGVTDDIVLSWMKRRYLPPLFCLRIAVSPNANTFVRRTALWEFYRASKRVLGLK